MRDDVVLCGFIPEITLYKYKSRMRFNNSVSTTPQDNNQGTNWCDLCDIALVSLSLATSVGFGLVRAGLCVLVGSVL